MRIRIDPLTSRCLTLSLAGAIFAGAAPAQYVNETVLDDYTQAPGTYACTTAGSTFWRFDALASSCHHRTFYTYGLHDPVLTAGGGTLDVQGSYFDDSVFVWTSCGSVSTTELEGCNGPFFPGWFALNPELDLTPYDRITMDFELRSSEPIRISLEFSDANTTEFHDFDYPGPGTYTLSMPPPVIIDPTAVWTILIHVQADPGNYGPLDLTLEPLTFEEDLDQVSYCPAGISTNWCTADLEVRNVNSSFSINFDVEDVEPQKDGLFFYGTSGRQQAPWGNGTSFQCVVPPVTRTPVVNTGGATWAPCSGWNSLSVGPFLWCSTCPQFASRPPAGTPVQVQFWYRDPQNTSNQTTSLSNAVEFIMP